MKNIIKKALTKTIQIRTARGETQQLEISPDQKLVYGIYFATAALITLTILETTYILVFHSFNNEILAAITLIIGTILGTFFSQKS